MTATVNELMQATLDIFAERDDTRRRALIAATYAEDIAFTDAGGTVTGREALNSKVADLLEGVPEGLFSARGPVQVSAELGILPWAFGLAGEPAIVAGTDIALTADGVITRLHTLLEPANETKG